MHTCAHVQVLASMYAYLQVYMRMHAYRHTCMNVCRHNYAADRFEPSVASSVLTACRPERRQQQNARAPVERRGTDMQLEECLVISTYSHFMNIHHVPLSVKWSGFKFQMICFRIYESQLACVQTIAGSAVISGVFRGWTWSDFPPFFDM